MFIFIEFVKRVVGFGIETLAKIMPIIKTVAMIYFTSAMVFIILEIFNVINSSLFLERHPSLPLLGVALFIVCGMLVFSLE